MKFSKLNEIQFPAAAYNMTFSCWEVINPRVYPIRLYISNERKFYNMKFSIDIGKIYKESLLILNRVEKIGVFKNEKQPGGMLIPLGKEK